MKSYACSAFPGHGQTRGKKNRIKINNSGCREQVKQSPVTPSVLLLIAVPSAQRQEWGSAAHMR